MAKRKKHTEMEVQWKPGCRFSESSISADKVNAEIQRLKNDDGEVTAEDLLDFAAAHPRSSLYKAIGDWDDSSAARKWRMAQSRLIIRSIEIVPAKGQSTAARAYSVDQSKWSPSQSKYKPYRSTVEILEDPEARGDLLQRALNELVSFQRRYRGLQELAILHRAIADVLDEMHSA